MKRFRSTDGTSWGVEVRMPTHSSAMVVFRHPQGGTARLHRYAWINAVSAESSDPRERMVPATVAASLDERFLERIFRRSMPIETVHPRYIVS